MTSVSPLHRVSHRASWSFTGINYNAEFPDLTLPPLQASLNLNQLQSRSCPQLGSHVVPTSLKPRPLIQVDPWPLYLKAERHSLPASSISREENKDLGIRITPPRSQGSSRAE